MAQEANQAISNSVRGNLELALDRMQRAIDHARADLDEGTMQSAFLIQKELIDGYSGASRAINNAFINAQRRWQWERLEDGRNPDP